ncbi:hypothetical protein [Paenibacillus sp. GCM10027626]|uniref:hypothetical protein n=1 Tax=Paenibacillus sp. GCM10027626 TaxID=3273411 RepID=UPI00363FD805
MVLTACTAERAPSSETAQLNSNEVKEETPGHEQTQFTTTIYSLDLINFKGAKINELPFYSNGEIKHLTEDTVKSFSEGHHPWLRHVETFIASQVTNLVPDDYKKGGGIKSEFIKIKNLSDDAAIATITLGSSFFYEITIEASENTGNLFFITNIVLHSTIDKK